MAEQPRVASKPTLPVKVCLRTEEAQAVYGNHYAETARLLYEIEVAARIQGKEEEADKLGEQVQSYFAEAVANLRSKQEQAKAAMRDATIEGEPTYKGALETEVYITTPAASQYLGVLRELDNLMVRIDALWLNAEITTKEKLKQAREAKKIAAGPAGHVKRLKGRLNAITRRAQETGAPGGAGESLEAEPDVAQSATA